VYLIFYSVINFQGKEIPLIIAITVWIALLGDRNAPVVVKRPKYPYHGFFFFVDHDLFAKFLARSSIVGTGRLAVSHIDFGWILQNHLP
jgi:hypothetical protein